MNFESSLVQGKLIKRYERFLADVVLNNGTVVTAHCTNSGSMKSCIEPNAEVYLTHHANTNRKTKYTWEMIKINQNWVGVNTNIPNQFAFSAISAGQIPELNGYNLVEKEKTFHNSRFDIKLSSEKETCFVEVKNVTYKEGEYALFPDAITTRGKKHLDDLIIARKEGYRAVMLYIIQRIDVDIFGPAYNIDKIYANTLKKAYNDGVEILAYQLKVMPEGISIYKKLPVDLNPHEF